MQLVPSYVITVTDVKEFTVNNIQSEKGRSLVQYHEVNTRHLKQIFESQGQTNAFSRREHPPALLENSRVQVGRVVRLHGLSVTTESSRFSGSTPKSIESLESV